MWRLVAAPVVEPRGSGGTVGPLCALLGVGASRLAGGGMFVAEGEVVLDRRFLFTAVAPFREKLSSH